jgi:hypothetical protein
LSAIRKYRNSVAPKPEKAARNGLVVCSISLSQSGLSIENGPPFRF